MTMQTETTINVADANEGIALIEEYLFKGGSGFDNDKLETLLDALQNSDRIVIVHDLEILSPLNG